MRQTDSELQWYVYTLRYPDNTIFYVGKGSGKRIDMHERQALSLREINGKAAKIIDIHLAGESVIKVIEAWFRVEQHAYIYESMLIEAYGLFGTVSLANTGKTTKKRYLEIEKPQDGTEDAKPIDRYMTLYESEKSHTLNEIMTRYRINNMKLAQIAGISVEAVAKISRMEIAITPDLAEEIIHALNYLGGLVRRQDIKLKVSKYGYSGH